MSKIKLLAVLLLIVAVLSAQIGTVFAAPLTQDETSIAGTVTKVEFEADENGVTTVLVTLEDDQGGTQTVRISVETAASLGLLVLDPATNEPVLDPVTGLPIVDNDIIGETVEIDPADVILDEEPPAEEEGPVHPIAALLASFFGEEASVVNGYHEDGFGFGVIAQALWMSKNLNGDASLAGSILEAKRSGDYSALFPEGTENVPTNWGQFKKLVSNKKNNLGMIVSGHADPNSDEQAKPGNGQGKEKENNNGKGKNNNNGQGKSKKDK
jgi:hypothetical protein